MKEKKTFGKPRDKSCHFQLYSHAIIFNLTDYTFFLEQCIYLIPSPVGSGVETSLKRFFIIRIYHFLDLSELFKVEESLRLD